MKKNKENLIKNENNYTNLNQEQKISTAKRKIILFLTTLIVIGACYTFYWFSYGQFIIKTEDAYITGNQNIVTSQVNGIIKAIYVENTQYINKGDLLAVIDDTNYKIALENAKANLGKTVRAYANLSTNVQTAQDVVTVKKIQLDKVKINFDTDSKSFHNGILSKHQFKLSEKNLKIAETDLAQAYKNLKEAKIQAISKTIFTHPEVQQGIAAYKTAYVNLMRTKIYAPENGIIANKSIFLGQQISASQQLMSIINLENIWVDANYKETQLKDIKIGNRVKIYSDVTDKTYEGYVVGISGASGSALSLLPAQNATGNWIKIVQRIPVRIAFVKDSFKGIFPPVGSSTTTTIHTKDSVDKLEIYKGITTDLYTIDEKKLQEEINEIISENLLKN